MITEIFLGIFTLFLIFEFLKYWRNSAKLPPGPFRWPVIGNVIELTLASPEYPHIALYKVSKKYGEIMTLGFGSHFAVVLSSYEAMKAIFMKEEASTHRLDFPYVLDRSFQKNYGIIFSSGVNWKIIRPYTMKTLREFGYGKANAMEGIMKVEAVDIVYYIRETSRQNGGILEIDGNRFAANAVNIIWNLIGGYRFAPDDEKLLKNLRFNNEVIEVIGHKNIYNIFPFVKKLFPGWCQVERHARIFTELQSFMRGLIADVTEKREGRDDQTPHCFVETFLDEIEKNRGDPNSPFTEEQLVVVLMDIFLAGSETTSTTLNWVILYLTLNPDAQRKMQEEIQRLSGGVTSSIRAPDKDRYPYTKAVLVEVFRHANVVPVPPPRVAQMDIEYGPYVIPKGTNLFLNLEPIYRDEKYWGDPSTFRPERFLDADGKLMKERVERVAAFGYGKRVCLAEGLAWDSMFLYMTAIFGNLTFSPIKGKEPSPEFPLSRMTIMPRPFSVKVSTGINNFSK